ncbi:phage baseplate assembly protein V [Comamonas sp. J-3]|uniref:phage baseplate assembly protein V n=1 Tax=Comamonas trifloxystrobinivorans TaxID=3350256 RepID=UPI003728A9CB
MSQAQPQRPLLVFRARAAHTGRMYPTANHELNPLEQARQLANVARLGAVIAVDLAAARCRVKTGDNETDWLPWFAGRSAADKGSHWWPPVLGEQCMVLSSGGDMGQGCVLLGVYSDSMPAPSREADTCRLQYTQQDFAETAKGEHLLHMQNSVRFEVADECAITLAPGSITLQAGGAVLSVGPGGVITANVDILSGGISAQHHTHGGVRRGDSNTDGPQ